MTLAAGVVVAIVVWTVSLIGPIRWRALVYSLPLPITLVLVTSDITVDGSQLLGVVGLNVFFGVVTLLHSRLGLHIAPAVAAGVAGYIALSLLIGAFAPIPFWPTLLVVVTGWVVATVILPTPPARAAAEPARSGNPIVKLGTVLSASLLMVALGGLLRGLVVTFPYAGILVAVETRRQLIAFSQHFARNSIGLVVFFAGYQLFDRWGEPLALTAGWLAFTCTALTLHLRRS